MLEGIIDGSDTNGSLKYSGWMTTYCGRGGVQKIDEDSGGQKFLEIPHKE